MGYIRKSGIISWSPSVIDRTPEVAGVYVLRNLLMNIIYIGSAGAGRLRGRLYEHWITSDIPDVNYFDWYQTTGTKEAREIESLWIKRYKPVHNFMFR